MQIIVAKFGEGGVGVVERSLSLRRDLSPMHQANDFLVVVTPQTTAGLPAPAICTWHVHCHARSRRPARGLRFLHFPPSPL